MNESELVSVLTRLSSAAGVASGALSIPCRYVHTPSEMVDSTDLKNAVSLLSGLLSNPWPAVTGR